MFRSAASPGWRLSAAVILVVVLGSPAAAQSPAGAGGSSSGFLTRADVSFTWAALITNDRRFNWQGLVEFDFDVVQYHPGRLIFKGSYEAVLGRERRRYDLNQGNYAFEVAGTYRTGSTELQALSRHASRHLVDRDNVPAISWNTVGVRALHERALGRSVLDGHIALERSMQQAYVDYAWMSDARVRIRRPVSAIVELAATASGGVIGINRMANDRKRICGGRIEGGVRFQGHSAALEVFAGYERRMDAFPTDRFRVRMFTVGFRLVSR